ncbi:MAG: hypothetical protein JWQ13_396 [Ramlibacter sp.]|jgi:hypothetical protein|nr:hypothetical protein [Ramlibacter sp.]
MRPVALILALISCALAQAQVQPRAQRGADLMNTPECAAARRQLDEVLAAGGPRERLDALREQTALKCFGVKPPPPQAGPANRSVPPPVAVNPIRLRPEPSLPRVPGAPAQAAPSPPPLDIPRPPVVTSCDAAGCWDSNGARYNQQGPVLLGPGGACTLQGGALNCP